jgi:hypothetical protein
MIKKKSDKKWSVYNKKYYFNIFNREYSQFNDNKIDALTIWRWKCILETYNLVIPFASFEKLQYIDAYISINTKTV